MVTKAYKVWGMFDGEKQHRQRESFKNLIGTYSPTEIKRGS